MKTKPKIHLSSPHDYTACGKWAGHPLDPKETTHNRRKVTCKTCKQTKEYRRIN